MKKIKELIKASFDKGVEWDKKILEKVEKKFNLSPYQSKCANAAIGFILGALITESVSPHSIRQNYSTYAINIVSMGLKNHAPDSTEALHSRLSRLTT